MKYETLEVSISWLGFSELNGNSEPLVGRVN